MHALSGIWTTIPVIERTQTYSLDRVATGIGRVKAAVRNTEKDTIHGNIYKKIRKILTKANSL